MDISWEDARLFLAVADTGSVSGAARKLALGQPTVSRRLADLEYALGFRLFDRSVAGTRITGDGERMLASAKQMSQWAGELNRAAESRDNQPRGVVRITAPPGVAFDFVVPFAAWASNKYPELSFQVLSTVEYLDLPRGEADLALRLRPPAQRDVVSVAHLKQKNAVFGARDYVKTLKPGYGLSDVRWVGWAPPFEHVAPNPELAALIPGFRPAFAADDFLVQVRAAEAGLGAIILGRGRHRFSGPTNLVPLALDLGPHGTSELHLVCAKSALAIPRVRRVADLLCVELGKVR